MRFILLSIIFGCASIILSLVVYFKMPQNQLFFAWLKSLKSVLNMIPLLIFTLAIVNLVQILIPQEKLMLYVGKQSGMKGVILGCLIGGFIPGGPLTAFPVVYGLYKLGSGIGTLVSLMTAWSLFAFFRLPLEVSFINLKFVIFRLISVSLLPFISGTIAHFLFSKYW